MIKRDPPAVLPVCRRVLLIRVWCKLLFFRIITSGFVRAFVFNKVFIHKLFEISFNGSITFSYVGFCATFCIPGLFLIISRRSFTGPFTGPFTGSSPFLCGVIEFLNRITSVTILLAHNCRWPADCITLHNRRFI